MYWSCPWTTISKAVQQHQVMELSLQVSSSADATGLTDQTRLLWNNGKAKRACHGTWYGRNEDCSRAAGVGSRVIHDLSGSVSSAGSGGTANARISKSLSRSAADILPKVTWSMISRMYRSASAVRSGHSLNPRMRLASAIRISARHLCSKSSRDRVSCGIFEGIWSMPPL